MNDDMLNSYRYLFSGGGEDHLPHKDPGEIMNGEPPGPPPALDDTDWELVLTFLTELHALEQALVRAGYTRAGLAHSPAKPDWLRFVQQIEPRFDPDSSPELQGAVNYLLVDPAAREARERRLEGTLLGEPSAVYSDIVWLSELVQQTATKLTYGMPSLKASGYDPALVMAALLVVEAWSYCDPVIESLLGQVH